VAIFTVTCVGERCRFLSYVTVHDLKNGKRWYLRLGKWITTAQSVQTVVLTTSDGKPNE